MALPSSTLPDTPHPSRRGVLKSGIGSGRGLRMAAALYDLDVTDRIGGGFGPTTPASGGADQLVGWNSEPRYSYAAISPIVRDFATAPANAKKVA